MVLRSLGAVGRGILAAVLYAVTVSSYWAFVWYNTRPEYHHMDWILIALLAYPVGPYLAGVTSEQTAIGLGIVQNSAILYLVVWLINRRRT